MSVASGGLGFGSGLARGLARGLLRASEETRDNERRAEEKSRQNDLAMLQFAMKQGDDTGDYSGVQQIMERLDPNLGKMFKKTGGSPFEMLAPILTPQKQQTEAGATLGPGNEAIGKILGPEQAPIPSTQKAGISRPDPVRWSFGGTPLSTPDERADRTAAAKLRGTEKEILGSVDIAARLHRVNPQMFPTMKDAMAAVGIASPRGSEAEHFQPVFGQDAQGNEVAAVFDQASGQFLDPTTRQPIQGFKRADQKSEAQLPAALREQVERIRSMHPDWDEAMLRKEATKRLDEIDAEEKKAKEATAEANKVGRDLLNETRRTNLALLQRNNKAELTPAQARLANTLADDYVRDSKPYVERLDAYNTLKSAVDGPHTAGASLSATFAFMKMIDPGSTVREGERAIVENSRGIPDSIRNLYNKVVDGVRLTDAQFADLMNQATQQFVPFKARQAVTEQTFRRRAAQQGIPAESVIIQYDVPTNVQAAPAGAPAVTGAPARGAGAGTVTVILGGKKITGTQAQIEQFRSLHPELK